MKLSEIKTIVESKMSLRRYAHVCSVEETASKLFYRYGSRQGIEFDFRESDLRKAAILHDVTKELKPKQHRQILEDNEEEFDFINESNKKIWHAFTGEICAREEFAIDDEQILEAIRYHTTGCANLGDMGKLIYVADYVEPLRSREQVKLFKLVNEKSLNEMCLLIAKRIKEHLKTLGIEDTEPYSQAFIDYLEKEIAQEK